MARGFPKTQVPSFEATRLTFRALAGRANAQEANRRVAGAFRGLKTGPFRQALNETHHELARIVQDEMVKALQQSVRARGREQRRPEGHGALELALIDRRNRRLHQGGQAAGFTVGIEQWLDSPASQVNLYWRNLEEGSRWQVGRPLWFLGRGEGFARGLRDASASMAAVALSPGGSPYDFNALVRVERPIPRYAYLARGARTGLVEVRAVARQRYEWNFEQYGVLKGFRF